MSERTTGDTRPRRTPEAEARGCYCVEGGSGDGLPEGFCGRCDVCGKPGHVRHHPGAVPVTGAWCDRHYRMTALLHPLTPVGKYVWLGAIAAAIVAVALLRR